MSRKLLLIDDNIVDRLHIRRLMGEGCVFFEAETVDTGLEICAKEKPDCVLLDYLLPGRDGLSALSDFVEMGAPVIMLTGEGAEEIAVAALKKGASDYLVKGTLKGADLHRAIQTAELHQTVRAQRQELQSNETRLFRLFESIPVGVYVMTADGVPYYANTAAEEILGKGLLTNARLEDFSELYELYRADSNEHYPAEDLPFYKALRGETKTVTDLEVQREHRLRLSATGSPVYNDKGELDFAVVVLRDVTEQVDLELQLRQAQKMEAVGRLAGGVAHDFNNLLTAIFSFGKFVLRGLEKDTQAHQDQSEVLRAAERARTLTNQLLAFSRKQPVRPVVAPIDQVLEGSHRILHRLLGEDIRLVLRMTPPPSGGQPWHIRVDPAAFEQVILNLAVNARDAMPSGGTLKLETRYVHEVLDESGLPVTDVEPGDYVVLAVADTGTGMDRRTQEQVFEPFFTTKSSDRGTGLGLATCYGIIRQAGGTIQVRSAPGKGTEFRVYLPRVVSQALPTSVAPPPSLRRARGSETIVVAEDDEAVRAVVIRTLSEAGYRVLSFPTGAEALATIESTPGPIELLLTDVIMPQMSGRQLADKAQRRRHDLKVLFMSGYTQSAVEDHGVLSEHVELIRKPFSPEALLVEVRRVIDANKAPRRTFRARVLYLDAEGQGSPTPPENLSDETETVVVQSGSSALELLRQQAFEVIVIPGKLPDYSVEEFFDSCVRIDPDLASRLLVLSGESSTNESKRFLERMRVTVLDHAVTPAILRERILQIVEKRGQSNSRIRLATGETRLQPRHRPTG